MYMLDFERSLHSVHLRFASIHFSRDDKNTSIERINFVNLLHTPHTQFSSPHLLPDQTCDEDIL